METIHTQHSSIHHEHDTYKNEAENLDNDHSDISDYEDVKTEAQADYTDQIHKLNKGIHIINTSLDSYKDDGDKTIEDCLEEDLSALKCLAMMIPKDVLLGDEFISEF